VIEGFITTLRMWTDVTVMWIEAVINVAVEVVRAVEPRASSDKNPAVEPLGSVVSIWGAVVWSEVVEAIRADRFWSDIHRDLGGCRAWDAQQSGNQSGKGKNFPISHKLFLTLEEGNRDAKHCADWK
jgi:hypothetical protein